MEAKQIESIMRKVMREENITHWPRWLGVKQLAKYISRPERSIYNMVSKGEIPCLKTGIGPKSRVMFDKEEIDNWMEGFKTSESPLPCD